MGQSDAGMRNDAESIHVPLPSVQLLSTKIMRDARLRATRRLGRYEWASAVVAPGKTSQRMQCQGSSNCLGLSCRPDHSTINGARASSNERRRIVCHNGACLSQYEFDSFQTRLGSDRDPTGIVLQHTVLWLTIDSTVTRACSSTCSSSASIMSSTNIMQMPSNMHTSC